uniref:DNA damage-regulated autophagy modulator protein 2-like n=1 Tax=Crassostrea virginica TaxID=6565 RepID=A0A8B8AI42_CRAVI|nr:DNA damage-regulated autophagy modulator protein 2-like [Crassostrea virginica]XP_022290213.1 DNA damage-regulated autophagy modulator protein 2-like [Crassostrea virginica]XP_022290221.1 DNA damage-regulated autophagy modulator protein 2-like [Crassostrea virginica]
MGVDLKHHGARVDPYPDRPRSREAMMAPKPPGCLDCLRTRLHLLPIITFTWLAITVCLSYLLAAIKRDTEADFPYISKTANVDPQRAIFAQMVSIGAVLYGMCATMRYLSLKADLLSCFLPRGLHRLNIAGLTTGLLVCLGNSLLANFPTDGYSGYFKAPHYVGATFAFFGGVVYGWIQTRLSWLLDRKQKKTGRIQMALMIWTTVVLVTFGISKIIYEVQKSQGYGTKEGSLRDVYLSSTVTEWVLAFSLAGFPLTFVRDFRTSVLRSPRIRKRDYLEEMDDGFGKKHMKEDSSHHI